MDWLHVGALESCVRGRSRRANDFHGNGALRIHAPLDSGLRRRGRRASWWPFAFMIDFLGYFIVGLCAFWLESTIGLALLYSRLTMLLGGMLMPLEVFPQRVQPVLRWLPFATVVYGPARMFVAPEHGLFWNM